MELPLFPLHTVLCPGVALPLHIFEPRYRALVKHCLDDGSPFGIVLIRDGREVGGGPTSIATVGTVAEIREAGKFSDGRYELLVVGVRRFRIESVIVGREPYLIGQVEEVEELVGDMALARDLTDRVTQRFVRYLALLQPVDGEDADEIDVQVELELEDDAPEPGLGSTTGDLVDDESESADERDRLDRVARNVAIPDDPTILSYLLSGIIQVDQPRRQELLEAATTEARLRELIRLIDREVVLLERRLRNFSVDPRTAALRRN
jgi:Lon protease-like protein